MQGPVARDRMQPGDGSGLLGVVGRRVARAARGEGHDGLRVLFFRSRRRDRGRDDDLGGEGRGGGVCC